MRDRKIVMNNIINNIIGSEIEDIFISGFLEKEEDFFNFHPLYDRIYMICSGSIYEIFLSNNNLDAKVISKIEPYFEVDEDDFFSISSIYIQVFNTEFPVKVLDISTNEIPLAPLCIKIGNYDDEFIIKIDPKNTFGLSITHLDS